MKKLTDYINSPTPTLIDFSAQWCGPCKMMGPILEDVKHRMGDRVNILKIDIDKNPDVANHFDIMAVPTLILFQSGKVLWRQSGVVPAAQLHHVVEQRVKNDNSESEQS